MKKREGELSKEKEVYTYGFPRDKRWPEEICPVPVDTTNLQALGWPSGPFLVHHGASKEFVNRVAQDRPGKLRTAVVVPQNEWVQPERHLAYFNTRILDGDRDAILAFVRQEKQP